MLFNSDTFIQIFKNIKKPVALHEPQFAGNEWQYVKECLDTGWVSSVGKFVDRFEADLAQFTGAKHAIATVNGTAALHIIYQLAGITKNDEVLVPTLTFIGTINPLNYLGAIPHFIDAEENHLGIDSEKLDDYLNDIVIVNHDVAINRFTHRPIKALCVMHTLGHPVDLDKIKLICDKYKIILLEDAAEALGSYYKNAHVGHYGLMGALSFNGNKIITTGGGGAILTNNSEIAQRAKHLTTTAKRAHAFEFYHDEVGFNYRLPNINAALGCAQLEQLSDFLNTKRNLAEQYFQKLNSYSEFRFIQEPSFAKSNYWLNAILMHKNHQHEKENLLKSLHEHQVFVRPLWNLQHTLPMYQSCPHMDLSTAESLANRLIKLPSSPQLGIINET